MTNRFYSALGSINQICSGFGHNFMSMQRRCVNPWRSDDCTGNPTPDEARRDFRQMMRSKYPVF